MMLIQPRESNEVMPGTGDLLLQSHPNRPSATHAVQSLSNANAPVLPRKIARIHTGIYSSGSEHHCIL